MTKNNDTKQNTNIAVIQTDIGYIKKSIDRIENTLTVMDSSYVKKEDLLPLEKDHEARLRRLETWGFSAIGALGIIQFALNYFK